MFASGSERVLGYGVATGRVAWRALRRAIEAESFIGTTPELVIDREA